MNINKESMSESLRQIEKDPIHVFQTPEAQSWDTNTLRFLRVAIVNNLPVDTKKIYQDSRFRARFKKLSLTGAHEGAHIVAAREVGSNVTGKVNEDGSGITNFILMARSLRRYVRDINFVGFMGMKAELALGETPKGHGFDMNQNDGYAQFYTEATGESGSAIQSEASAAASQTVNANLDKIINIGVRLGLEAAA